MSQTSPSSAWGLGQQGFLANVRISRRSDQGRKGNRIPLRTIRQQRSCSSGTHASRTAGALPVARRAPRWEARAAKLVAASTSAASSSSPKRTIRMHRHRATQNCLPIVELTSAALQPRRAPDRTVGGALRPSGSMIGSWPDTQAVLRRGASRPVPQVSRHHLPPEQQALRPTIVVSIEQDEAQGGRRALGTGTVATAAAQGGPDPAPSGSERRNAGPRRWACGANPRIDYRDNSSTSNASAAEHPPSSGQARRRGWPRNSC